MQPLAIEVLESVCQMGVEKYFKNRGEENGWDPEGFRQWLISHFPVSFPEGFFDDDHSDAEDLERKAKDRIIQAFKEKYIREDEKVPPRPDAMIGNKPAPRPANEAIRNLMIRKLDQRWQEHLLSMDHLRSDVNLRTFGQRDPLMEFKHEAFILFDEFSNQLRIEIAQGLFRFEILTQEHPAIQQLLAKLRLETNRSFMSDLEANVASDDQQEQLIEPEEPSMPAQPITVEPRAGRNDICPCGSGKKYKKCCGAQQEVEQV